MKVLIVFGVLFCSTLGAFGAKLPPDFKICKRSELPKLNECLKTAMQDAVPKIRNGIPSLKVREFDPLFVQSATIGEGKGAVNVVQKYKDFNIYGMADTIINDVAFKMSEDAKAFEFDVKVRGPEYRFAADYNLQGRVLLLPVTGEGKCNVTLKNCHVDLKMSGKMFEKKGKDYLKVTDLTVGLNPELVTYKFDNLFNGDEALGTQINALLNDNWKEIFEDVKDGYQKLLESVFTNYANSVFSKVPVEDLLPSN